MHLGAVFGVVDRLFCCLNKTESVLLSNTQQLVQESEPYQPLDPFLFESCPIAAQKQGQRMQKLAENAAFMHSALSSSVSLCILPGFDQGLI